MAVNEERLGVFPQVTLAFVVALLIGGTAPWWAYDLFSKKNIVRPSPLPAAARASEIRVRCSAEPQSIHAGGRVEIMVSALTEKGSPVSGANVRIESGGGRFSKSGTTTEIGDTDFGGVFMTQWQSPEAAFGGYEIAVTVTRTGFSDSIDECVIGIE